MKHLRHLMLRKTCLLWMAMAICCLIAGLSIKLQAGHTDLVNSDRTTNLFADSYRFWYGAEATTGDATTPTITQTARFGPAWLSSVEAALVNDMAFTETCAFVDNEGTDWTTTASATGVQLTAARLPATITYSQTVKDSHNLRMLWMDGFAITTLVADTYTTSDASDTSTKLASMISWLPSTERPVYTLGRAPYVCTITTNTITGTSVALTITFPDAPLAGFTVSKSSARTFYLLAP